MTRFLSSDKGNAAVEMALLLPMILSVLLGGIDAARFALSHLALQSVVPHILTLAGENWDGVSDFELAASQLLNSHLSSLSGLLLDPDKLTMGAPVQGETAPDILEIAFTYDFAAISPLGWVKAVPDQIVMQGFLFRDGG